MYNLPSKHQRRKKKIYIYRVSSFHYRVLKGKQVLSFFEERKGERGKSHCEWITKK